MTAAEQAKHVGELLDRAELTVRNARKVIVDFVRVEQRRAKITSAEVGRQCGVDGGNFAKVLTGVHPWNDPVMRLVLLRLEQGPFDPAPRRKARADIGRKRGHYRKRLPSGRNVAIVRAFRQPGATKQSVGREFSLSRERVRQIVRDYGDQVPL